MIREPLTATVPPRTSGDDKFESVGTPALDNLPLLGPGGTNPEDYNSSKTDKISENEDSF